MCGLVGILLYPAERSESDWMEIRRLFAETLVANEERGRDASGIAVVQRDGTFCLFKGPMPASELLRTKPARDVLEQVGSETVCLLGHTRYPTKGSPTNNDNNHPLVVGQILGIHNGVIRNDDDLFVLCHLPRQAEVDSEILFRLMDTVPPFLPEPEYLSQIKERLKSVNGTFATLSVNLRRPNTLIVTKSGSPLCLHYEPPLQALFFSSRYVFLRKAFGRSVVTEALEQGYIYAFAAERLPERGHTPSWALSLK